jgi:hypothetical protein
MAVVHTVTFLEPCYVIYGDETGLTTASGNTFEVDVIIPFTLHNHTFVQLQGNCTSIRIMPRNFPHFEIKPTKNITIGPNAWAILQPPVDSVYTLAIIQNGQVEEVTFVGGLLPPHPPIDATPTASQPIRGPGPVRFGIQINNGAVYNGLNLADSRGRIPETVLLSVEYFSTAGPTIETPPAVRGQETGELLTGEILSILIRTRPDGEPFIWVPEENIGSATEGLPIVVFGDFEKPGVAIMPKVGAVQIVNLVQRIS